MRRVSGNGHVTARELVRALRAGFDASESVPDRVFDRLVVAELEVQERPVLDRSPVAPVNRLRAQEVERTGNPPPAPPRHHQHDAVAHGTADDREERTVEIGPPPLARAGVHVEVEERVPDRLGQFGAAQPDNLDAVLSFLALPPDGFPFARGEGGEKIVETLVTVIEPVELPVGACEQAYARQIIPLGLGRKRDVQRRSIAKLRKLECTGDQSLPRGVCLRA